MAPIPIVVPSQQRLLEKPILAGEYLRVWRLNCTKNGETLAQGHLSERSAEISVIESLP